MFGPITEDGVSKQNYKAINSKINASDLIPKDEQIELTDDKMNAVMNFGG